MGDLTVCEGAVSLHSTSLHRMRFQSAYSNIPSKPSRLKTKDPSPLPGLQASVSSRVIQEDISVISSLIPMHYLGICSNHLFFSFIHKTLFSTIPIPYQTASVFMFFFAVYLSSSTLFTNSITGSITSILANNRCQNCNWFQQSLKLESC